MSENFTDNIGDEGGEHVGVNLGDAAYGRAIINTVAPNNALLLNEDGTYQFRRWKMTGVDLIAPDGFSDEEYDEFGFMLSGLEKKSNWWRGLWANLSLVGTEDDIERGRIYKNLANEFGMNKKTLQNCAAVCRYFEPASQRWEGLSFSHHSVVAGRSDAQKLLAMAVDEDWSVAKLRSHIAGKPKRPTPIRRFVTKTISNIEDRITRFTGKERQKAIKVLEEMLKRIKALENER